MTMTSTSPTREQSAPAELPPSTGGAVCRFIEQMLVHGEGDWIGEPFLLEDWQRRLIWDIYAFDPVTNRRIVRKVLLVMPKGCGKTALTAAICLAELAGPTSLDEHGRPCMRRSPNVPIAAASFEQADRLFGAAKTMATEGPLAPFVEAYDTEILLKDAPGRLFRIAAAAGTNDGGLPTCFGADEIHEWTGGKKRLHLVVANSLTKRQGGLELNITTPDDADPDSLLGTMVARGTRVNSGEVDDPSFLFRHWTASGEVDLDDPAALRAAIREATPASFVPVEAVAARWEVDRIPRHEFERYHLARFVRGGGYWLPEGSWESQSQSQEVADETEVVLGFDGSYSGDSTALVGCTLDGYVFVVDAWERPENAPEDWIIPREEVKARVKQSMERWSVVELACDPPGWDAEIDEWEDTYDVVHRFFTNKRTEMATACSRFYTSVVFGELTHDGDPRLARHLRNAVAKETAAGVVLTKDAKASPRKIDIAVAAIVAHDRAKARRDRVDPSVYEDRGAVVL